MKDYNTITNELLERRDKYLKQEKERSKIRVKRAVCLCTVSTLLMATALFSAMAATNRLRFPFHNEPHITDTGDPVDTVTSPSKDSYVLSCNAVAGDSERVYFDLTVVQKDGLSFSIVSGDEYVGRFDPYDAYIEFSDGYKKDIYFTVLGDSTDKIIHIEASSLFSNSEKKYFGQEAKIYVGGINAMVCSDVYTEEFYKGYVIRPLCMFDEPLLVTLVADKTERHVTFDEGVFEILDGRIKLTRGEITATSVNFYGSCSIEGKIYELQDVLEKAYLICDGEKVPLGAKTNAGTEADGEFVVGWLCERVVYPDKVDAIFIEGKTIPLS